MKGRGLNLQVGSPEIKWVGKSVIDGIKAVGDRDYSSAQVWEMASTTVSISAEGMSAWRISRQAAHPIN